jgi:hypothetical protein
VNFCYQPVVPSRFGTPLLRALRASAFRPTHELPQTQSPHAPTAKTLYTPGVHPPRFPRGSSFSVLNFALSPFNCFCLTPFLATLTDNTQLAENPATLSPAFATLTHFAQSKSIVCNSYTKSPGVGGTPGNAHLRLAPTPPPPNFQIRRPLQLQPIPQSHLLSFHILLHSFAFFCTLQKPISRLFNRIRTLSAKYPGGGVCLPA